MIILFPCFHKLIKAKLISSNIVFFVICNQFPAYIKTRFPCVISVDIPIYFSNNSYRHNKTKI